VRVLVDGSRGQEKDTHHFLIRSTLPDAIAARALVKEGPRFLTPISGQREILHRLDELGGAAGGRMRRGAWIMLVVRI